jgi:amino acid transporter
LERRFGGAGALAISLIIALSALTSIHATIFLAARSNFALGRDSLVFAWFGRWNQRTNSPRRGLLAQCGVSLALVALACARPNGSAQLQRAAALTR